MSAGKRLEERQRVIELAGWVGAMFGDNATKYAVYQYVRTGAMPDGSDKIMPDNPEVDAKVAEIERTGVLIVDGK